MKIIRLLCLISLDILICFFALYLSYSLLYQEFIDYNKINFVDYIFSSLLLILIFYISKIYFYRARFLPQDTFIFYLKYLLIYLIIFLIFNQFILYFINEFFNSKMFYGNLIPRSVVIINFLIVFFLVIISRKSIELILLLGNIFIKFLKEKKLNSSSNINRKLESVCIYGAGSLGNLTLDFLYQFKKDVNIDCFFDDNENLHGQIIKGIKIYSIKETLKNKNFKSSTLYISIKDLDSKKIEIINKEYSKYFERVVYLSDQQGNLKINALHDETFNIDLNKIISSTNYSKELKNFEHLFQNKNVLVTGCAGSIGKELVMQIIKYKSKNLYLIDKNEHQLFELESYIDLLGLKKLTNIKFILVNLADVNFKKFINLQNIDIVFHAAAYKHVNMAEKNTKSVMYNNIISTYNICKFSAENKIKNFVNVSTDKAVNPKSVMGLSKRICEMIVSYFGRNNNYYSVRFGNVLNSSGSVLPIFLRQIKNNQKITIRDLEVTRYFMSIPEAISLILLSVGLKKNNNIFIFDMGKPVKIFDIAKRLCKIYHKNLVKEKKLFDDVEYIVTGLKNGEKLHEELYLDSQDMIGTEIKKIFKITDNSKQLDLKNFIDEFINLIEKNSENELKKFLFSKI